MSSSTPPRFAGTLRRLHVGDDHVQRWPLAAFVQLTSVGASRGLVVVQSSYTRARASRIELWNTSTECVRELCACPALTDLTLCLCVARFSLQFLSRIHVHSAPYIRREHLAGVLRQPFNILLSCL
jgi:hypothetical protein